MTANQPVLALLYSLLKAMIQLMSDVIAGSREGLEMWDRYKALSRLSDRELARRGLTRADITGLVVNGEGDGNARIPAAAAVYSRRWSRFTAGNAGTPTYSPRPLVVLGLVAMFAVVAATDSAEAHKVRFIASDGNDANNCTRNAPCLTLQRGIDKTPAGSELITLDSGDFGDGATIDKSMTISAIGVSATIGGSITINAADATVVLRGLRLDGAGTAADGIAIVDAAAVHIVDCEIRNFANHGITAVVTSPTKLFVSGSVSRNNGFEGLVFLAGAGGALVVDNSRFEGNAGSGLNIEFSHARITDTIAAGNATYGIFQLGGETNVTRTTVASNGLEGYALFGGGQMTLDHSVASGNLTGLRVEDGSKARISLSVVTDDGTGLLAATGSKILTRKNNTVWSNTTDITIDATATLKRLKGK